MTTILERQKEESDRIAPAVSPGADRSRDILAVIGTVVRMSAVPQFLIDRNHILVAWNRALEELTGIREEALCGTTGHWRAFYGTQRPCLADLVVDEAPTEIAHRYQDKWTESECIEKAYEAIDFFPGLGKSGKWLHVTAVPVRDSTGMVIGTIESLEDLTELRLMERALSLSNKKLQLMNSIAWHEIENKITSLRGYIEFSKEITPQGESAKCFEAEEMLLKKIHDLLVCTMDYQKIGEKPPQWIKVKETIRAVLSVTETGPLTLEGDVPLLEIYADPAIERMFTYLVKNILKSGRPAPVIRLSCAENPDGLLLVYEDNGPGIPHARKERLFREKIVNSTNFYTKFIHDLLAFSGMSVRETGDPATGLRFEIQVPRGAYRFIRPQG
ncbi:PAS domain-containing protein [Methanoregula sp.]|uniref:PAS domain-containing protein n=1 Tax=Methanoregula sp. TaxID=2052170 RepID=UPI002BB2FA1A|nr:PAS domain-containing protein [Methanoregula sp.]HVP96993.1 PAS domain-containing protein [Methanoregula sp.]